MKKSKYSMKEKLDIAESVVTILMFIMAVWGSIISFEQGFWHKLNHVVNHYHQEFNIAEQRQSTQDMRRNKEISAQMLNNAQHR